MYTPSVQAMNRKTIKSPQGCVVLLCVIALIAFTWAIYEKYQIGITELQKQINPAFRQAINEELDSRFGRCEKVYIFKKGEDVALRDHPSEGISQNYRSNPSQDNILHGSLEQQAKQTHLLRSEPISADSLNAYFNKTMSRMGITVSTQVIIKNLETHIMHVSKNIGPHTIYPYSSDALLIDTEKTIQVQAFVYFPVGIKLLHSGWSRFTKWVFFTFACILLALLIYFYKFFYSKFFEKRREKASIRIINRKEGIYQIGDIVLCTNQQSIFFNKEKMKISARSMQLLETMILDDNHILSKDFAYKGAKNENTLNSENNLQVAIKRLRTTLSIDPRIEIKTIRNTGYQLLTK